MKGAEPLDNPIWHALTQTQARFAIRAGPLRWYPPEVAPFSAFEERDEAALALALADSQAAPRSVVLFRPQLEPAPLGWSLAYHSGVVQMICPDDSRLIDADVHIIPLSAADVPDILELVDLTKPGSFGTRTTELGAYFGVREAGRLVALSGERLRLDGFTEVSAVCTHPDWRGHGLARQLVSQVARKAFSEGQTPFLHVVEGNDAAIQVYRSLGFVERTRLHLSVWAVLD